MRKGVWLFAILALFCTACSTPPAENTALGSASSQHVEADLEIAQREKELLNEQAQQAAEKAALEEQAAREAEEAHRAEEARRAAERQTMMPPDFYTTPIDPSRFPQGVFSQYSEQEMLEKGVLFDEALINMIGKVDVNFWLGSHPSDTVYHLIKDFEITDEQLRSVLSEQRYADYIKYWPEEEYREGLTKAQWDALQAHKAWFLSLSEEDAQIALSNFQRGCSRYLHLWWEGDMPLDIIDSVGSDRFEEWARGQSASGFCTDIYSFCYHFGIDLWNLKKLIWEGSLSHIYDIPTLERRWEYFNSNPELMTSQPPLYAFQETLARYSKTGYVRFRKIAGTLPERLDLLENWVDAYQTGKPATVLLYLDGMGFPDGLYELICDGSERYEIRACGKRETSVRVYYSNQVLKNDLAYQIAPDVKEVAPNGLIYHKAVNEIELEYDLNAQPSLGRISARKAAEIAGARMHQHRTTLTDSKQDVSFTIDLTGAAELYGEKYYIFQTEGKLRGESHKFWFGTIAVNADDGNQFLIASELDGSWLLFGDSQMQQIQGKKKKIIDYWW